MQPSPVLFANALNSFGALLWLILGGAIIWWLIWLLLKADESDKDLVFDQPTPVPGSGDESTSPVEPATPLSGPPSRAFTIWTQPGSGSPDNSEVAAADSPGDSAPEALAAVEGPPSQAFTIWTQPDTANATAGEESAESEAAEENGLPELDTATAEEAAARFQDDLDSGKVRQDELLGVLYDSPPDDVDDLKKIKGVAKVIEGKLHDFGIYKFEQIAFWTDTATAEFAKRLSFKERIYRDDWIAQAKGFHEDKYGEKL